MVCFFSFGVKGKAKRDRQWSAFDPALGESQVLHHWRKIVGDEPAPATGTLTQYEEERS